MNMDIDQFHISHDMRKRYLDRRSKDVKDCSAKLLDPDWDYFERLGHQLKGNAASYGYVDLGSIAFEIEQSALNKNFSKLKNDVNAFKNWVLQRSEWPL